MGKCAYCGNIILFGGKRTGDERFCSTKCQQNGVVLTTAKQVPLDLVKKIAKEINTGPCPKCKQRNVHVDLHSNYKVYSVIFYTRWWTEQSIICSECAVRTQRVSIAYCTLLGWWGGWGWLVTPVQIRKNLGAMLRARKLRSPSSELEKFLSVRIAAESLRTNSRSSDQKSQ